ncbi:MAG: prepilin-type N-terminal cleavage/methylation domain-containing protein [Patescibacteria group bacterium]
MIYEHTRRKSSGFTLVEMLMALFIMSVTAVFVTFVAGTIKTARDSGYENIAFHIASSKLDELRAGGYAALPADGSFSDPGLASIPNGQASTSITVWNTKTKQVVAGISWRSANGSTRVVSLTTLVTQVGGL